MLSDAFNVGGMVAAQDRTYVDSVDVCESHRIGEGGLQGWHDELGVQPTTVRQSSQGSVSA